MAKKGKYEKTVDYQLRVTKEKRDDFIKLATANGIQLIGRQRVNFAIESSKYFPDDEICNIKLTNNSKIICKNSRR